MKRIGTFEEQLERVNKEFKNEITAECYLCNFSSYFCQGCGERQKCEEVRKLEEENENKGFASC